MITVQNTYSCPLPKTKLSCAIVFDLRNIGITIAVWRHHTSLNWVASVGCMRGLP